MKSVIVTIEMDIDETQVTNGGIAEGIHHAMSHGELYHINSVVCRDANRHAKVPPNASSNTGESSNSQVSSPS